MKRIFLLALLSLFVTGCANWSRTDTVRELAWQGLNAVDYGQTKGILKGEEAGTCQELNPFIKKDNVEAWFIGGALAHWGISAALPRKYRNWWQNTSLVVTFGLVLSNEVQGFGVNFSF